MEETLINNCYERIFNNYLEILYLELFSIYKDKELTMNTIFKSIEKVFMVDYKYITYQDVKDKVIGNIAYLSKSLSINDSNEKDAIIDERLYLLNFNFHKFFSSIDCKILILLIFHKESISEVSKTLNIEESNIKSRFHSIFEWMKTYFINTIRPNFL